VNILAHQAWTYGFVVRIYEYDLVVLVYTVLVDPVRVEDPQISTTSSYSLFSNRSQTALELEMVDTLSDGLAIGGTCRSRPE
jgi:hypothetical protein